MLPWFDICVFLVYDNVFNVSSASKNVGERRGNFFFLNQSRNLGFNVVTHCELC